MPGSFGTGTFGSGTFGDPISPGLLTVCNAIQDLIGASTRITSAPHMEAYPDAINDADLPISLTRPGMGHWPHENVADVWDRRAYISEVYVKATAQGLYHEGIQETASVIQDIGERLTTDYTLSDVVIDSEPRDRGVVILTYGGQEYQGTVFEIDASEDV